MFKKVLSSIVYVALVMTSVEARSGSSSVSGIHSSGYGGYRSYGGYGGHHYCNDSYYSTRYHKRECRTSTIGGIIGWILIGLCCACGGVYRKRQRDQ